MIDVLRGMWPRQNDVPREAAQDRISVTGVYASGKSYFARRCSARRRVPFISFDDQFDYARRDNQSREILRRLPRSFVMDAIPIDEDASWGAFAEYQARHHPLIVCVYCPDAVQWLKRVAVKAELTLRKSVFEWLHLSPALPRRSWRLARRIAGTF